MARKPRQATPDDKESVTKELQIIRNLLALQLRSAGVSVELIAKAMSVSAGRVSQMIGEPRKKRKKSL